MRGLTVLSSLLFLSTIGSTAKELRFPLTNNEQVTLDELNSIRSLIGNGHIGRVLKVIKSIKGVGEAALSFLTGHGEKALDELKQMGGELAENLKVDLDAKTRGWGSFAVNTSTALLDVADVSDIANSGQQVISQGTGQVQQTISGAGSQISGSINTGIKSIPIPFGRKKRNIVNQAWDTVQTVTGAFNIKIPDNVLGPAANMEMLRWNRRLAQLAMLNIKEFEAGVREVEYQGRKYKMFEHGSLAEYIIANFLGKTIAQMFSTVQIGFVAVKLVLGGVDAPIANEKEVENKIYEAIFADRKELGCLVTAGASFCIIGPIGARVGQFYESGETCTKCKTPCIQGMCRPPTDYSLRDKFAGKLRPNADKFNEVVEDRAMNRTFFMSTLFVFVFAFLGFNMSQ
ncbi:unnamed protein product [Caenorhabditis sp. 36 PRJEB53466]|nr:unnamed protein product [Caenorhabditis sp. 36 PRJEB53466]